MLQGHLTEVVKRGRVAELRAQPAEVNGEPGTLIYDGDRHESVVSVQVNPEKLSPNHS